MPAHFPLAVFLLALVFSSSSPAAEGESARWLRDVALSPDGTRIACRWRGEICLADVEDGILQPLTRDKAFDGDPCWTPDGKGLVFASDRCGNLDLYTLDLQSGTTRRLTWHEADDRPWQVTHDGEVLFSSRRGTGSACALAPLGTSGELYGLRLADGRLRRLLDTPARRASRLADGSLLYEDLKGIEDPWRKHHRSAVTRDIWLAPADGGEHRRLTPDAGEDLAPLPDGAGGWYCLSEASGTLNLWHHTAEGARQVTHHEDSPVRFPSRAEDGTLCYVYDGEIRLLSPSGEGRRLPLQGWLPARGERLELLEADGSDAALCPTGEDLAVCRRGEIFLVSAESGEARRLTDTPWEERDPAFSPGGDSLVFVSREPGNWRLKLARYDASEGGWLLAASIRIEDLGPAGEQPLGPRWSPDGKALAYGARRSGVHLLDLQKPEAPRVLLPAESNYRYTDAAPELDWSPDGRWLLCVAIAPDRWSDEVWLLDSQTGDRRNLSQSGYEDLHPRFDADGEALYWLSDRLGLRTHGGAGGVYDLFRASLTAEDWERSRMDAESHRRLLQLEQADSLARPKKKRGLFSPRPAPADTPGLEPDLARDRLRRMTPVSGGIYDYLVVDEGETILALARFGESINLWKIEPREDRFEMLLPLDLERGGRLALDAGQEHVYILTGEGFHRAGLDGEEEDFQAWPAGLRLAEAREREALWEHVRLQVRDRFYDQDLHGRDWEGLAARYKAFLPHVDTARGLAELLSEVLGELDASHTGAYALGGSGADTETGLLGVLLAAEEDGMLRITEVLPDGPAARPGQALPPGARLLSADGQPLRQAGDLWRALQGSAGRLVEVGWRSREGHEGRSTLRPWTVRKERQALYHRWVRGNTARVDSLSGGRLGYVHIPAMEDPGFRELFSRALGEHAGREGLVVDVRGNGGGFLTDDLVEFFSGRRLYRNVVPPGERVIGEEPWARWNRPVVVLVDESCYSDSHIFPHAMREMGLARLVGMPMAGTGTAVWWEHAWSGTLGFGIPQVGQRDNRGQYLENQPLHPDLQVDNLPGELARGIDRQLEAATADLLQQLGGE